MVLYRTLSSKGPDKGIFADTYMEVYKICFKFPNMGYKYTLNCMYVYFMCLLIYIKYYSILQCDIRYRRKINIDLKSGTPAHDVINFSFRKIQYIPHIGGFRGGVGGPRPPPPPLNVSKIRVLGNIYICMCLMTNVLISRSTLKSQLFTCLSSLIYHSDSAR